MLEIWGRRNASNVIPVMWAIGEMGITYLRHDVGGSFGGLDTAEYRAMNPNGRIPTITDDGCTLWESNAIIRYLSAKYGEGSLWNPDPAIRSLADRWMEWFKTTAYPHYIKLFWAIARTEPAHRDPAVIAASAKALGDSLQILDAQLATHPYVAGDSLTMGDIPFGPAAYRYFNLDIERPELPNVSAWYRRLCDRSAYQEHAMIPFGRNPAEWDTLERAGPP